MTKITSRSTNVYDRIDLEMKAKALATCEQRGGLHKLEEGRQTDAVPVLPLTINYVALETRYRLRPLPSPPKRHITSNTTEELKFDGHRAIAIKSGGRVQLRSRNDNDFSTRYSGIVKALAC